MFNRLLDALGTKNNPVIVFPGGSVAQDQAGGISGISDPPEVKRAGRLGTRGPGWDLGRGHLDELELPKNLPQPGSCVVGHRHEREAHVFF